LVLCAALDTTDGEVVPSPSRSDLLNLDIPQVQLLNFIKAK
jgi:hypothetical protein